MIDRNEDGSPDYAEPFHGNTCQNCGRDVTRLTLVPEFEYMGCDDCMEEALAVIAKEAAFLAETGCTVAESEAFLAVVVKAARRARQQGELFTEVA